MGPIVKSCIDYLGILTILLFCTQNCSHYSLIIPLSERSSKFTYISESIDLILTIYSIETSPQEFRLESHSILLTIPIFLWILLFKSIDAKGSLAWIHGYLLSV